MSQLSMLKHNMFLFFTTPPQTPPPSLTSLYCGCQSDEQEEIERAFKIVDSDEVSRDH